MANELRMFFSWLVISLAVILASCSSTPLLQTPAAINDPILSGKTTLTPLEYKINTVLNYLSNKQIKLAKEEFETIDKHTQNSTESVLLAYTQAKLQLSENHLDDAYNILNNPSIANLVPLSDSQLQVNINLLNADVLTKKSLYFDAVKLRIYLAPLILNDDALYKNNHNAIWQTLNRLPPSQTQSTVTLAGEEVLASWLSLNTIIKSKTLSLEEKSSAIDDWYTKNPTHPAAIYHIDDINKVKLQAKKEHEVIAVILPFKGKYSGISEAVRDGFMKSYFDSAARPTVHYYNENESEPFVPVYQKAIKDGATLVIGPLLKPHLDELYKQSSLPVQTLALNKLNLSPKKNLFQYSIGSEDEVISLINLARKNRLKNAFVIAQNDDFSQKNLTTFTKHWLSSNNKLIFTYNFIETAELNIELEKPLNITNSKERIDHLNILLELTLECEAKARTDIDAVFLLSKPEAATNINQFLNLHLSNNTAIYAGSSIYRGFPNPENDHDLDGIIFADMPIAITPNQSLSEKYIRSPLLRLFAFGMDAFALTDQLDKMAKTPDHTLEGKSGKITLIDGEAFRETAFAVFSNGIVEPLPESTSK